MPSGKQSAAAEKAAKDNRANQCNPNHPEYRGIINQVIPAKERKLI